MPGFIDFKTLQRPASPNTAFLAPPGFASAAAPDGSPPVYDAAPGELYQRALRFVTDRGGWQLGEQDPASLRLSFIAVSPLMRFKDDVDLQILPVDGQPAKSTFAAYSRSRVGYSDLGANRKRLDALSGALMSP
jgi:uncharacterized protein (DUF1499 family)